MKNENLSELITVILPVYNGEKYIDDCIKNILGQTYSPIELLIVDDGSTDKSGEIADSYAEANKNVRVIHQLNRGSWSARNTGLDNSRGEYIGFVDVDDYIKPEMIEDLYNLAKEHDAEIAICDRYRNINYKNDFESMDASKSDVIVFDGRQAVIHLFSDTSMIKPAVWDKIYRKNIFENIRCENTFFEDVSVIYKVLFRAQTVAVTRKQLYGYSVHEGSLITSDWTKKKTDSYYKNLEDIERFFEKYDDLEIQESINYFRVQWGIESWESMAKSINVTKDERKMFFWYIRRAVKRMKWTNNSFSHKKKVKKCLEFLLFARFPYLFLILKKLYNAL